MKRKSYYKIITLLTMLLTLGLASANTSASQNLIYIDTPKLLIGFKNNRSSYKSQHRYNKPNNRYRSNRHSYRSHNSFYKFNNFRRHSNHQYSRGHKSNRHHNNRRSNYFGNGYRW